jgi:hypothetical protein
MVEAAIIREPDDPIADTRISIGTPKGKDDFYFVFRGDPEKVVELLERVLPVVQAALPAGLYEDTR